MISGSGCASFFLLGTVGVCLAGCSGGEVPLGSDEAAQVGATGPAPTCDSAESCTGDEVWTKRFGDWHAQGTRAVTTDADHNVLVAGQVDGNVDFGGGKLDGGVSDLFVAKYDAAGTHLWSHRFGPASQPFVIATDASGRVIVGGAFTQTTDWGAGEKTASKMDAFIEVFDAAGSLAWGRQIDGLGDGAGVTAAGADAEGNVLIAGLYWGGPIDLGGGPLGCSATPEAGFVAKLDPDGNHIWSKCFDDALANSLTVDASGDVVISGTSGNAADTTGSIDFGGGPRPVAVTGQNLFAARFDGAGNHVWSQTYPGRWRPSNVVLDGSGNALLCGAFLEGTFDLGGATKEYHGGATAPFIAKLGQDGEHVWSRIFDETQGTTGPCAADATGHLLFGGSFAGDPGVDYGGGQLAAPGSPIGVYLAKFSPAGEHVWSRGLGGDGSSSLGGLAVDSSGNVVLTGSFERSFNVGDTQLTSAGDADIFVAKLWP